MFNLIFEITKLWVAGIMSIDPTDYTEISSITVNSATSSLTHTFDGTNRYLDGTSNKLVIPQTATFADR